MTKLPLIPPTMPTLFGAVPVERVHDLRDKHGQACYGIWDDGARTVRLEVVMSAERAWHTYWHEWAHAALSDAGAEIPSRWAERACDAVAQARVREMLDSASRRTHTSRTPRRRP